MCRHARRFSESGDEFDRAYLQAPVDGHRDALDTIRELQPNARSGTSSRSGATTGMR